MPHVEEVVATLAHQRAPSIPRMVSGCDQRSPPLCPDARPSARRTPPNGHRPA
ncbi:hypothetical protein BN2537_799 [Streptomyces venezuelae]|nr:hypothetical protein BN2537_799 [Streptomyces venezuelae]